MSATASAPGSSRTAREFTGVAIREELGVQTKPAERLAQLDSWEELREGISSGRDWEDLDGVGPSTAETLSELSPDELPGGEAAEPSVDGEDAGVEEDGASEDEEEDDGDGSAKDADEEDDESEADHSEGGASADDEAEEEANTEADSEAEADAEAAKEDEDDGIDLHDVRRQPPVFKAMVEQSRIAPVFDAVSKLVDEAKVRIGEDRINIRAVDPANVGMIDLDMSVRAFDSYQAEPGVIGINLSRMNDILSTGSKDDTVRFDLDTQTRKLVITVGNIEYTMALIDPDSIRQEPDLPELELNGELEMEGQVLHRAVTASDMVSEHMHISYTPETAVVKAEGDTDDVQLDLSDEEGVIGIDTTGDGESIFSLDYLKRFKRMVNKKEPVTLEVGNEFPLMLNFTLADDHVDVDAMLAPRIQS